MISVVLKLQTLEIAATLSCLVDGDFDCMGSLSSSHLAGSFQSRYSAPHDG